MTKKYNQLTLEQRYKIEALIKVGKTHTEVANHLRVHRSTIGRELRRNVPQRGLGAKVYVATQADLKTRLRHTSKAKQIRFTEDLKVQAKEWMIIRRYSPELISAQWARDKVEGVSYETIYKFIWHCKHTNKRTNKG